MSNPHDFIGIFDSGIGGLTVTHEITKLLPNENIIYLGDTARVPYGTRSKEVITNFATELVTYLLKFKIKILVAACNTISATCLPEIQAICPVPILGVITPTIKLALKTTKNQKIAVLATQATIDSHIFQTEISKLNPNIKLFPQACPLFVPIAEEGLGNSPLALLACQNYLQTIKNSHVDTAILGCTHYPLLQKVISQTLGSEVTIIDSAKPTALALKQFLTQKQLLNTQTKPEKHFYVTDDPSRVLKISNLFFGQEVFPSITQIKL